MPSPPSPLLQMPPRTTRSMGRGIPKGRLDSLIQAEAFTIPVGVIREPERFAKAYKVHGVPLTVVVRRGGRAEGAWLGMVDDAKRQEIREAVTRSVSAER